jgi:excisionase family DNA binding protein
MIHAQDIIAEIATELPMFLTTEQVAGLLQCTRRQVYRIIRLRRWQTLQDRPGSPVRIPKQVVMAYLSEHLGG